MENWGRPEFNGRAWPAAEIAGPARVIVRDNAERRVAALSALEIRARGGGKPFYVDGAAAWWRNFAEVDVQDADSVLGFVRRHGDPLGELETQGFTDTSEWQEIRRPLHLAAACWQKDTDISRAIGSDTAKLLAFNALAGWRQLTADIALAPSVIEHQLSPKFSRPEFTFGFRVKTAATLMVLSALSHLQSGIEMAKCQQCGDWFHLYRRGSKFCSNSCRAINAKARKER